MDGHRLWQWYVRSCGTAPSWSRFSCCSAPASTPASNLTGPALAATDQFRVVIQGKQAHGASPDLAIDPIVTASQAVLALQTIRSRNLSPFEPSVVTVGVVRGGTRWNIIPAEVELHGTVRSYGAGVSETVERRMREILGGVTRSVILDLARAEGIEVVERAFSVAEAKTAREAFLTSTSSLVLPVTSIDGQPVANGAPGSITRTLLARYRARLMAAV